MAKREPPEGFPDLYFPRWVSEQGEAPEQHYMLTRAACFATLLRLSRERRRFPRMEGALREFRRSTRGFKFATGWRECVIRLHSQRFGALNPFTASQCLRALIELGERRAHGGVGFLAFFAMSWSLFREFPDRLARGSHLDPMGPTAYMTAKCLIPIRDMREVCKRRAKLMGQIKSALDELAGLQPAQDAHSRWRLVAALEKISRRLFDVSSIVVEPDAFRKASQDVAGLAERFSAEPAPDLLDRVVTSVSGALEGLKEASDDAMSQAEEILRSLKANVLQKLEDPEWDGVIFEGARVRLASEWKSPEYWPDLRRAAQAAWELSFEAYELLRNATRDWPRLDGVEGVTQALVSMQEANTKIAGMFASKFRDHARWCRKVVAEQIAHVSAHNDTDFDAAEMASAIAVAVAWGEMPSSLEVQDAVDKAVRAGSRGDGSWTPGQPFESGSQGLSLMPGTSDVVRTQAAALKGHREIKVADRAFDRYLDWLDRTRIEVRPPEFRGEPIAGWRSDRSRDPRRVDLWATAQALDALLELREIHEFRLWEICRERFTVLPPGRGLADIDPVDLGATHGRRLHRMIAQLARDEADGKPDAIYSIVLHGPPGTSKTSIAEALGAERGGYRPERATEGVVRITPADFTRSGAERLDSEARFIFRLLGGLRGVTLFFDEIDDLLHRRDPTKDPTFMKLVTPAMLNRLQDLRDACPQQEICLTLATNFVDQIEPALLRKGRIDECIPVVYADADGRRATLWSGVSRRLVDRSAEATAALRSEVEQAIEEAVPRTRGWDWKALDGLAKRFAVRLNQKAEASNTVRLARLREELEQTVEEQRQRPRPPDYAQRLRTPPPSPQLMREVLRFAMALAENVDDYAAVLAEYGGEDLVEEGRKLWIQDGRK
jgi:hypothetical protein